MVQKELETVVHGCNFLAMKYLGVSDFVAAVALIRRALAWTKPGEHVRHNALRMLSLNNYACVHRRCVKTTRGPGAGRVAACMRGVPCAELTRFLFHSSTPTHTH